jgi:hypothetical protein
MMCTLFFLLCRLHEPAPGLQDNWYGNGMGAIEFMVSHVIVIMLETRDDSATTVIDGEDGIMDAMCDVDVGLPSAVSQRQKARRKGEDMCKQVPICQPK